MKFPRLLRDAVARRHVKWHEDYLVQGYVDLLRRDNAKVRRELDTTLVGFTPSGRRAAGLVIARLLIVLVLVLGVFWWRYSEGAVEFRDGYRRGYAAGAARAGR